MATFEEQQKKKEEREQLTEMLGKGFTPEFIKLAVHLSGGEVNEIDTELNTLSSLGYGGEQSSVEVGGKQFSTADLTFTEASALEEREEKLKATAGLLESGTRDLEDKVSFLKELEEDVTGLKKSVGTGVGGRGVDLPFNVYTNPDRSRFVGKISKTLTTDTLDTLINAKNEGATFGALSEGELSLLRQSASALNSWAILDKDGRITGFNASEKDVKEALAVMREHAETALTSIKDNSQEPSDIATTTKPVSQQDGVEIKGQLMTIEEAKIWANENPDDPISAEFLQDVSSGLFKKEEAKQQAVIPTDTKDFIEEKPEGKPLAKKIGDFLGISKFGEGIGTAMFLKTKDGKELIKKAEAGDQPSIDALKDILDDAPNAKELVGSAALTALNIGSFGLSKGVTTAGTIAKGTGLGGAFGVAGGIEQDKDAVGVIKSGVLGSVIGGAFSAGAVGFDKWKQAKKLTQGDKVTKAVGQILQGKKKDVASGVATLNRIDTKGVTTYAELLGKIDDNMASLGNTMDDLLAKDTTKYVLGSLDQVQKVGDKKVSQNFVREALEGLQELYVKSSDKGNAERINQLLQSSMGDGLNVRQINDIAIEYGRSGSAFTRAGDLKKTASAVSFENIRKGVKETFRKLLPDDKAKQVDKAFSENFNVMALAQKMDEKVNGLMQRVNERTLSEKGGRLVGAVVDKIPVIGGGARGFLQKFVPSNAGNKTMNSKAIEEALKKNLQVIENNGEKLAEKILKRVSTGGAVSEAFILNLLRELQD